MIDLNKEYLEGIKRILHGIVPDCKVIAYGSRVCGNPRQYSDLDIAIVGKEKISMQKLAELEEAFSNSNLPIILDVSDWHAISPEFKKIIKTNSEIIQKGEKVEL